MEQLEAFKYFQSGYEMTGSSWNFNNSGAKCWMLKTQVNLSRKAATNVQEAYQGSPVYL